MFDELFLKSKVPDWSVFSYLLCLIAQIREHIPHLYYSLTRVHCTVQNDGTIGRILQGRGPFLQVYEGLGPKREASIAITSV